MRFTGTRFLLSVYGRHSRHIHRRRGAPEVFEHPVSTPQRLLTKVDNQYVRIDASAVEGVPQIVKLDIHSLVSETDHFICLQSLPPQRFQFQTNERIPNTMTGVSIVCGQ